MCVRVRLAGAACGVRGRGTGYPSRITGPVRYGYAYGLRAGRGVARNGTAKDHLNYADLYFGNHAELARPALSKICASTKRDGDKFCASGRYAGVPQIW